MKARTSRKRKIPSHSPTLAQARAVESHKNCSRTQSRGALQLPHSDSEQSADCLALAGAEGWPMNMHEVARDPGYAFTTVYRILGTLTTQEFLPESCDGGYARSVSLSYDSALIAASIEKIDLTDDWLLERWAKPSIAYSSHQPPQPTKAIGGSNSPDSTDEVCALCLIHVRGDTQRRWEAAIWMSRPDVIAFSDLQ
jgi:hypothetical protein